MESSTDWTPHSERYRLQQSIVECGEDGEYVVIERVPIEQYGWERDGNAQRCGNN